jgi:hypothetical protein
MKNDESVIPASSDAGIFSFRGRGGQKVPGGGRIKPVSRKGQDKKVRSM